MTSPTAVIVTMPETRRLATTVETREDLESAATLSVLTLLLATNGAHDVVIGSGKSGRRIKRSLSGQQKIIIMLPDMFA
jgi:hypothetical protein